MTGLHNEAPVSAVRYHATSHYNTLYNRTDYALQDNGETITDGMAKRLAHYARKRLSDLGFGPIIEGLDAHVSGSNLFDNSKDADLDYQVEFHLAKGGIIGVQGILTTSGWPSLDHGIFCH